MCISSLALISNSKNASSIQDCVYTPRTDTSGASYDSKRCSGGWSQEAFDYAYKYNVTVEALYPYVAANGTCKQTARNVIGAQTTLKQKNSAPGYSTVAPEDVSALKEAVKV